MDIKKPWYTACYKYYFGYFGLVSSNVIAHAFELTQLLLPSTQP